MKLKIDNQLFPKYPGLILGVVVAHNINNQGNAPELEQQLREAEDQALETIGECPITEHPHISPWREAYRLFGAKPKKYPSSIENLIRRISKGDKVRHINKLVDIYNVISLKNIVPVGGEDLDKMQGDIRLTIAGDSEEPVELLGDSDPRPPYKDEVIYKDDLGTICRRWNWKEADRTKLTETTNNAVLVIEGLPPVKKEIITNSISELGNLINKHCGGDIKTYLLDVDHPECELE